jgi:5-methylthioribose kinase
VTVTAVLEPEACAQYLQDAGLLSDPVVTPLSGGVSSVVLRAEAAGQALVVKQALPRLRVEALWEAKRERTVTEAAALRLAASLTPGAVPAVVHLDEAACLLVIEAAEPSEVDWRTTLLADRVEPELGARLGAILGTWQRRTAQDPSLTGSVDDPESFDQQRIDPYYRTVLRRHPSLAPHLLPLIEDLSTRRECFVHGDFSPKNVLTGKRVWVVDFEVAHVGMGAFDVSFLLSHLLLKSVHRPQSRAAHEQTAVAFWEAYTRQVPVRFDDAAPHTGALLLARVDGKSPAPYLTLPEQREVWQLGTALLTDPVADLREMWSRFPR